MDYVFQLNDEEFHVYVRSDIFNDSVVIESNDYPLFEDSKGKYFLYNHNKFYLHEFKKLTKQQLLQMPDFTDNDLCLMLLTEGPELVPFTFDEEPCHIRQTFRSKVTDNFMLNFISDKTGKLILEEYTSSIVRLLKQNDRLKFA